MPAIYDFVSDFSEGLAAVSINKKLGYINNQGKVIIQPQYELPFPNAYSDFNEGMALVKTNNKWVFIDKNNNSYSKVKFNTVLAPFNRGMALVATDEKIGYVNKQGEFIWSRDIKK